MDLIKNALINDVLNTCCSDPFGCLGLQESATKDGLSLVVWQPGASAVRVLAIDADDVLADMSPTPHKGLFYAHFAKDKPRFHYRLEITYQDNNTHTLVDPYQFPNTTFVDPDHHQANLYKSQGAIRAKAKVNDSLSIQGTRFAVYAPAARSVSVVGDFNAWDGRTHPMSSNGDGIWRLFVPDVNHGARYKFEIRSNAGEILPHRSDPYAQRIEQFPSFASVTCFDNKHQWQDDAWVKRPLEDLYEQPMSIYELHLGSWRRKADNQPLTYLEIKDQLVPYAVEMGYTHVELLPVTEYPFDGSWGYQPVGLYAVTSRFGTPEEFKTLVDALHQANIGVIMDWVPAHFPADSHGLANFDGSKQYEYPDPKKGWHPEWNSVIYDFGKEHVVNYLISNAVYWLEEFHIDGLRVDAVASMLYLDYSREDGEWIPNKDGGNHNYEAIDFLRRLNETVYLNHPRCFTVAEESTAFPGVSKPTYMNGLGFGFKWNMGWMNDSLDYIKKDPIYRQHHQGELSFSMVYAFDEQFVLPISHDEVVHGKGSMITKMPGDAWQKFANLRAFSAYMYFHPGKKLNFMGNEFAQGQEWSHERSLDWHLLETDYHKAQQTLSKDLNHLYQNESSLHFDHSHLGFEWISYDDNANSILAFARKAKDSDEHTVAVINFTPTPHANYHIGVPKAGRYHVIMDTDETSYTGSGYTKAKQYNTQAVVSHGREQSIELQIPPLAGVLLKWLGEP
ncbi:1,4-alpha-glucan branching protein GlgB [Marinomonas sp. M1K-6]|uniref:1,4-alpha-glucan branching enzyme GlgB n=1 Tax=Marinomonas profundi TaxID=2726122 RepID=A0A847R0D3_9GAMM|nr:1,4-alpha-glucan branching protein GlgB [Marinomonas profundi]NLQ16892.1 1,4-alpha-glucan branching protein GlgB [Marinomonas profundi]UDV02624.1 1,4-alpha-glucan branching protein GlgB [Marinomonas profundi]